MFNHFAELSVLKIFIGTVYLHAYCRFKLRTYFDIGFRNGYKFIANKNQLAIRFTIKRKLQLSMQ